MTSMVRSAAAAVRDEWARAFAEGEAGERTAARVGRLHVWKIVGATTAPRIVMPPSHTASAST